MEKVAQSAQKIDLIIIENISKKMKSSHQLIKDAGFIPKKYSSVKDPVILFMALDRKDNNAFTSTITNALYLLDKEGLKVTPKNLSKKTRYSIKEIELNLNEIECIMDAIGIE